MPHSLAPLARSWRRAAVLASVPLASLSLAAGCGDEDDVEGEARSLVFSFVTDDVRSGAGTPLAVGSTIALDARADQGADPAEILEAHSDDPRVVEVVSVQDVVALLEARGDGFARIEVTARIDGQEVTDALEIEARTATAAMISDACEGGDAPGLYLTSSRIDLPLLLSTSDGRVLTGWGVHPVTIEPEGALQIEPQARTTNLPLRTTEYAGEATITSELEGDPLTITIVPEGAIDGARLGNTAAIARGSSRLVRVFPTAGDVSLCQGEPRREVITDTLDVCSATEEPIDPGDPDAVTWVRLEAFERGTCRFAVRFPEGDEGRGLDEVFEVEVQ